MEGIEVLKVLSIPSVPLASLDRGDRTGPQVSDEVREATAKSSCE